MITAVFFTAVALIAYAFVGYPALMALLAALAPRPVLKAPIEPAVALVVVVHDGADLIARKLESCLAQDYPERRLRVVVASDGSADGTAAAVRAVASERVQLLEFPTRRGKAACLNEALATCAEEFIVFTDVRQPLEASAVRRLVENFADPAVGAVSGELVLVKEGMTAFGESMDAYWTYEKFLRRMESRFASTVGVTGALYALRRECWRPIPDDTILDDVLVPMNVVLQGKRTVFESRAIAYDRASREAHQERTRKVRTLAGNFQLLTDHPRFAAPWRNPIAFQYLSHKVARLLVPVALAAALAANVALAVDSPFYATLLAAQAAAYALAGAGLLWPRAARLRLVKVPAAFVLFNWFVVLGFVEYFSNREAHLWKTR